MALLNSSVCEDTEATPFAIAAGSGEDIARSSQSTHILPVDWAGEIRKLLDRTSDTLFKAIPFNDLVGILCAFTESKAMKDFRIAHFDLRETLKSNDQKTTALLAEVCEEPLSGDGGCSLLIVPGLPESFCLSSLERRAVPKQRLPILDVDSSFQGMSDQNGRFTDVVQCR